MNASVAPRSLAFLVTDMWRVFRWRTVAYLGATVANGLLEGMAIVLLFPLLALIGIGGSSAAHNPVADTVDRALAGLGIEVSLGPVLLLIITAFLLQNLVFLIQGWLAARLQNAYVAGWRESLFDACLNADWRFHLERRNADLVNGIIVETTRVGGACYLIGQILGATVITAIYLSLALLTAWQATAMILACATVILVLTHGIVRHGRTMGRRITRDQAQLTHEINETFAGLKVVKAMAVEGAALARVSGLCRALAGHYFWVSLHPNLLRSLFEVVIIAALAAMVFVGYGILAIDVAALVIVVALFVRLYPRVSNLQQNLQALYAHLPAVDTVHALRAEAAARRERDDGNKHSDLPDGPPEIVVRGLSVRYGELAALDGVDLLLSSASTTAIVGASGAGKTTLVDCLLRLIAPDAGEIRIDGRPLQQLPLRPWRRCIGYVPQETFLFNASIRDNIAWAYPDATPAGIERAARRAHAHDFIMATAQGYDSIVGDRGVRLSGGQRQRIGLARALLLPTKLLILDEATSALDSEAEAEVMQAIRSLRGEITIIIIAHRLSTVRHADRVHVLDRGRVVEHGSWQDLLSRPGRLKALWDLQTGSPVS